ncbi:transposase [Streptosporangium roseum]|uniref:transposase n=1 Tax=Streptosporangium roseum TaxID=2001 RepID=UPI003D9DB586
MPSQRYPSNLSDAQWTLVEPLLPESDTDGPPEKHPCRKVVNAILYVVPSDRPWCVTGKILAERIKARW